MLHPIHYVSFAVCVVLVLGVVSRRNKRVHITLMLLAIVTDLCMVVWIEFFGRGAFDQAAAKMGPTMIVHIAISVVVLVLYGVQIATGLRKLRGANAKRHGRFMIPLIVFRLANFGTSILVMGLQSGP